MKKETIKWRLSKLPTPDEVRELVKDKIITQEEARKILFSSEIEEERDVDSLKSEIKFLRELVEKLSKNKSEIITTIREIEIPVYKRYPYFEKYEVWCSSDNTTTSGSITANSCSGTMYLSDNSFASINTF